MFENALSRLVPDEAGAVWLGFVLILAVFGDLTRWRSRRNVALVCLFAPALLFIDILEWTGDRAALIFLGVFLATAGYAAWGLVLGVRGTSLSWRPNLSRSGLRLLLAILLAMNAVTILGRFPNDAGYYTNLGAQRWTETGIIPYGDELLKGPTAPAYGAAATYGPLMYVAHMPVQVVLGRRGNRSDADPREMAYERPPVLATRLTVMGFYAVALAALFSIVRRRVGTDVALGVLVVFAGSPYISGLGGEDASIMGLSYVSHIAPSAVVLAAFAFVERPVVSGGLLAAAVGTLFYPVFMFPAWFGWHLWTDRRRALLFLGGFAGVGLAILLLLYTFTPATADKNFIALFLESTLEHQEGFGQREYGSSPFSFWGTHPGAAAFWQTPIAGTGSLLKPTFLAYATFVVSMFFVARRRTSAQLAGLLASVAAAVQLWKTHATGSYVEWWFPLLLIALFTGAAASGSAERRASGATSPADTAVEAS